jgi:minor extracellular serine protease Vpr
MGLREKIIFTIVLLCMAFVCMSAFSQHATSNPAGIPPGIIQKIEFNSPLFNIGTNPLYEESWIHKLDPGSRLVMSAHRRVDRFRKAGGPASLYKAPFGIHRTESDDEFIDVFVRTDASSPRQMLDRYHATLRAQVGDISAVRMPVEMLESLARDASVQNIGLSSVRVLRNNKSKVDTHADLIHQGFDLPRAYQGEGVVVGVLDSGIDFTHPDFSDENGTRIQYLLEYTQGGGQNEWTKAQIDANPAAVTQRDGDGGGGHGTHVTGSAAGGGRITVTMNGVAPKSDIIFVKGIRDPNSSGGFGDVDVVAGVQYIFQKAQAMGKPAVVNLSLGGNYGPLDGTSLYEQSLSGLTGPGKIIVAAAGNEGYDRIHAGGQTQATIPNAIMFMPDNPELGLIQMWYKQGAVSSIAISAFILDEEEQWISNTTPAIPIGQSLGVDQQGNLAPYELMIGDSLVGYIAIDAVTTQDPDNGDGSILILILGSEDQQVNVSSAIWVVMTQGMVSEKLDAWVIRGGEFYDQPLGWSGFTDMPGNTSSTIGSPSTARKVIAAGSYVTSNGWTDIDNINRQWRNPDPDYVPNQYVVPDVGQRSYFSSRGPTRDGRNSPDIAAPGEFIFSPMSSHITEAGGGYMRFQVLQGGNYLGMQGTSMASPHLTGVVALMLQANPTLTYDEVVSFLQATARSDAYTGAVPNNLFGAGKVDAHAVMKWVTGNPPDPGENFVLRHFEPGGNQYNYILDNSIPIDSGFVFGTNRFGDKAKAQQFTLPVGMTKAYVSEIKVWYGYRRSGLTTESYALEILNGTEITGPAGTPLYTQTFPLSGISADDDFQTTENATVYVISPPVEVGSSFFVSVNLGVYGTSDFANATIATTQLLGRRIPEVWEQWNNNAWYNLSDAWFGQNSQTNTGTDGAHLWIEAAMNVAVSVSSDVRTISDTFILEQNYPNPFNPSTTIRFNVPGEAHVSLIVYDILGREVARLVDEQLDPGMRAVLFDCSKLPSGIYYYRLRAGDTEMVRRMVFAK